LVKRARWAICQTTEGRGPRTEVCRQEIVECLLVIVFEPSTLRYWFFIYHTLGVVGCPVNFFIFLNFFCARATKAQRHEEVWMLDHRGAPIYRDVRFAPTDWRLAVARGGRAVLREGAPVPAQGQAHRHVRSGWD
jgi:hypothetical protein